MLGLKLLEKAADQRKKQAQMAAQPAVFAVVSESGEEDEQVEALIRQRQDAKGQEFCRGRPHPRRAEGHGRGGHRCPSAAPSGSAFNIKTHPSTGGCVF